MMSDTRDVREVLLKVIAELEAIGVAVPVPLRLAVLLLGRNAVDDRSKP